MRDLSFDIRPFALPTAHVGGTGSTQNVTNSKPRYDSSKVGYGLFQLWNQFQAQVKAMVDPDLIAAMDNALAEHIAKTGSAANFKLDAASKAQLAKPCADPGVDRKALMTALRDVKAGMKDTGLDPQTKMELMGYAQTLLDGLGRTNKRSVEVGAMTSMLLTGLGFRGAGL